MTGLRPEQDPGEGILLAIDTSTRFAGVALWNGDVLVASLCWHSARNHTAELMPAIAHILDVARSGPVDLVAVAVALGPGGFSALRVGLSAAKGLAQPMDMPLLGIGTLEMEAYPYAGTGLPVRPLLDVGRGDVATALFQIVESRWKKLEGERVCAPDELMESISMPTLFCGEGVAQRSEYLRESLGGNGVIVDFHTPASRLAALGALARDRLKRRDVDSLASLQPLYLRKPSIGAPKAPQRVKQ